MNIIFDLGGVVLCWEPERQIADFFPDKGTRKKIITGVFKHKDWAELDRGTLSSKKAIERANKRTGISKAVIRSFIDDILEKLVPKPEMIEFLKELKRKNHKLYVLSNLTLEAADLLEKKYTIWELFDGIIFSSRIKLIKPSPEIYQYILNKFSLIPEETVFLDDLIENVDAAVREGINGIHFQSIEQAKIELYELIEG
jgi:epoxide hydrolase-like predicted phosphatase